MGSTPEPEPVRSGKPLGRPPSAATLLSLVVGAGGAALLAVGVAVESRCGPSPAATGGQSATIASAAAEPRWPSERVALVPLTVPVIAHEEPVRVYLDAGHGAEGNTGNVSARCTAEQDFTLQLTGALVERLQAADRFVAIASRTPGQLVPYAERVEHARQWRADLFISLHSDVRGRWSVPPGDAAAGCPNAPEAPGFAVLWSDEGDEARVTARLAFARELAWRLQQIGLPAYDGEGYRSMYEPDEEQPGVFVDRHPPGKRIFVLRTPDVPSVILETHNAWHPGEVSRWAEPATFDAVASAIMAAAARVVAAPVPHEGGAAG